MTSQKPIFEAARHAARSLALRSDEQISSLLRHVADAVDRNAAEILEANSRDLSRMAEDNPMRDRLQLTPERISDITSDMRTVASLPSPLGRVLSSTVRPNGMKIDKVSVPFGVIGVVYEARPNVTLDIFSLCMKAGSACLLKGGSEAYNTNECIVTLVRDTLIQQGWDEATVTLMPVSHEATTEMLNAIGYVDLVIPRGSKKLIEYVRDTARVPVIETGAGVCHTYFHKSGDIKKGRDIVFNAKTRRVSVCNALDTLVIDRSRLDALVEICSQLATKNVTIYADDEAYAVLYGKYPHLCHATESDFGREWLDYKMSIATAEGIDEAINFINEHTSRHSECIVSEDKAAVDRFLKEVDAACVYANVSTSFTDGGQFGFGAEIGISTQKLHARGPMGIPEITTYKYIITGDGQTRW